MRRPHSTFSSLAAMGGRRAWPRRVSLGLGALGAALGALAVCGAFCPYLDLLTHLLPLWACLGLGGALAAAAQARGPGRAGRGVGPLAVAAITLACVIALTAPDLRSPSAPPAAAGPKESLRLIQLNVWKHNKDLDHTAEWVLAQRPDVVVLEEAFAQNLPLVRRLRASLPYRVSCTGRDPCSTTILSRAAPIAGGGLKDRGSAAPLAGAWATYPGAAGPYSIVAVQLPWPAPPSAQQARTRQLVEAAKGLSAGNLIIAGDFNTTSWSYSLRRLDHALGLRRVTRGLPTWPARGFLWTPRSLAFMPIDQVYIGRDWELVTLKRGERVGSDHYPLVVDLRRAVVAAGGKASQAPPGALTKSK